MPSNTQRGWKGKRPSSTPCNRLRSRTFAPAISYRRIFVNKITKSLHCCASASCANSLTFFSSLTESSTEEGKDNSLHCSFRLVNLNERRAEQLTSSSLMPNRGFTSIVRLLRGSGFLQQLDRLGFEDRAGNTVGCSRPQELRDFDSASGTFFYRIPS